MRKKHLIIGLLFFFAGIGLRLPLQEHYQSHWDGPQYSIGIVRYSLIQETPAIPGYPLYELMGRILYIFTRSPHGAILLLSVLFGGIGTALAFFVGKRIFSTTVGIFAALFFLTSPTVYYLGLTAYPYGILPTCSFLAGYIIYEIVVHKKNYGILLGTTFALIFGFRPQELFFLPIFFLFGVWHLSRKQKILALLSFILITLLWLIPFLFVVGGIDTYLTLIFPRTHSNPLPPFSLKNIAENFLRVIKGFFQTFVLGSVFFLYFLFDFYRKRREYISHNPKIGLFFLFWIMPPLLFNVFVRSDHAGYQMDYLAPLILLLAFTIYSLTKKNKLLFFILFVIVCISNLFWFFKDRDPEYRKPYTPSSFHYSELRKNDKNMEAKLSYIMGHFNPKTTFVITKPDDWRPVMYYLKSYHVDDFDGLFTKDPQFMKVQRDAYNWTAKQAFTKELSFIVPQNIKNVVFYDNAAKTWNFSMSHISVDLPVHSSVTYISVVPNQKIYYSVGVVK